MNSLLALVWMVPVGALAFVACGPTPAAAPGPTAAVPAQSPATLAATRIPVTTAAPAPTTAAPASPPPPATRTAELRGDFVAPLSTLEDMDTLQIELGRLPGVISVSGGEHSISITYDPSRLTPERLRQALADLRHPIRS